MSNEPALLKKSSERLVTVVGGAISVASSLNIEMDTNAVERTIRPVALTRKNALAREFNLMDGPGDVHGANTGDRIAQFAAERLG
jgi:hypothetical protein